jgi:hypothetical protein
MGKTVIQLRDPSGSEALYKALDNHDLNNPVVLIVDGSSFTVDLVDYERWAK